MASFFVGPMPPHDFLDTFLPSTSLSPVLPFEQGMFSRVHETASEAEMYDTFVEIVGSRLPKLTLVNTSRKNDKAPYTRFTFSCQPDCSVYRSGSDHNHELNSALVEFPVEFKTTTDQDPFVADLPMSPGNKGLAIENPFMSTSYSGRLVAGQITAYATLVLSAQYRTHTFLVLIFKNYARLIRWDRSGAVVTAPIYYDNEPHLLDFFVRYNHADPETRGHDPTVGPPTEDEVRNARTLSDLASAKSLLAVSIADPLHPQQSSRYIICAPFSRPDIPAGRWTRTSIAYDVRRRKRVLLKDSWRVLLDDVTPEGEIYARLCQHSVPNIPSCSRAGDVGDDAYHNSRTHEFVGKYGGPMQLTPHRHYRLVLDTIGRRLENFSHSWEMVSAIYASLVGELANVPSWPT
ncbi:hypothetical protein EDB84DRAFT_1277390 [Lactarius hengduanensis]|nr:hypothetical protein EDB84DRAFT_1277390 [Lactarius hengduanensis]